MTINVYFAECNASADGIIYSICLEYLIVGVIWKIEFIPKQILLDTLRFTVYWIKVETQGMSPETLYINSSFEAEGNRSLITQIRYKDLQDRKQTENYPRKFGFCFSSWWFSTSEFFLN